VKEALEEKKNWSFAELEKQEAVRPDELVGALEDYAKGGWAINSSVVIGIFEGVKEQLSAEQLDAILESCAYGAEHNKAEASRNEYRIVLQTLKRHKNSR
jgi:hypothetical protein